jgi:DNA damage-binding protein 1
MNPLPSFELDPLEQGLSIMCCQYQTETINRQFIVVGTAYSIPEEHEPTRGRLLVFEISADRRPVLLTEKDVKGAVFSLASLHGRVVAGVGSKIQVFRWVQRDDGSGALDLHYECGHQGHIFVLYIKTRGDYLLVGDLLRSVTLLQYKATDGSLEEVSRDFNQNSMRAIEIIDDDFFLGTEDKGNMFIVRRPSDTHAEEDRCRLESQTEYHIGDYINVLQRGSLNSQPPETDSGGSVVSPSWIKRDGGVPLGATAQKRLLLYRFYSSCDIVVNFYFKIQLD